MIHIFSTIAPKVIDSLNKDIDLSDKIRRAGGNTGNIVWFEAVRRSIKYASIGIYPDEISDQINIVIPMANQIHAINNSLESWAAYLRKYNSGRYRVTMVGLGAQLTPELNTPKKLVAALPKERVGALKELASHTVSIGVRGCITAECLELMGIKNYRIIGCPSFYLYGIEELIKDKKVTADKLCVSWGSENYHREQYIREFFRNNARDEDILLLQAMDDFPKTLCEDAKLLERHIESRYPDITVSSEEIEAYIKTHGHIFFDWDTWRDFLKREQFTLSVGCRFHGNMMSYLAGIPALWIVHDSRTYELCEAMKLPYINIEKAAMLKEREQFAEYCKYGEKFNRNLKKMCQLYEDFLTENGIERVTVTDK